MSEPVAIASLAERIEEYGPIAYLVTVNDDGRPHIVSVVVGWRDDDLAVGAGRRTAANAAARPSVTLLWPASSGQGYSLIVDGTARGHGEGGDDEQLLVITPVTSVLHRTPDGDPSQPSCVTVLGPS